MIRNKLKSGALVACLLTFSNANSSERCDDLLLQFAAGQEFRVFEMKPGEKLKILKEVIKQDLYVDVLLVKGDEYTFRLYEWKPKQNGTSIHGSIRVDPAGGVEFPLNFERVKSVRIRTESDWKNQIATDWNKDLALMPVSLWDEIEFAEFPEGFLDIINDFGGTALDIYQYLNQVERYQGDYALGANVMAINILKNYGRLRDPTHGEEHGPDFVENLMEKIFEGSNRKVLFFIPRRFHYGVVHDEFLWLIRNPQFFSRVTLVFGGHNFMPDHLSRFPPPQIEGILKNYRYHMLKP